MHCSESVEFHLVNMGDCGEAGSNGLHKDETLYLKVGAMAGILIASGPGVAIPLVGSKFRFLKVDGKSFLGFKAFSAGVILATGFVHILGEASERLSSECLRECRGTSSHGLDSLPCWP